MSLLHEGHSDLPEKSEAVLLWRHVLPSRVTARMVPAARAPWAAPPLVSTHTHATRAWDIKVIFLVAGKARLSLPLP